MLTTDTQLQSRAGFTSTANRCLHQTPYPRLINAGKGIVAINFFLSVDIKKRAHVVSRETQSGLGEVIGSKAEKLRRLRDLVSRNGCPGHFDHSADLVGDLHPGATYHFIGNFSHNRHLVLQLSIKTNQGDHYFRPHHHWTLGLL